jgi:hypothetical protein
MLRHSIRLRAERTSEQLDDALQYMEAMGEAIEREETWAPRLNANCCYCSHRTDCPAMLEVVKEQPAGSADTLETVVEERERLALIAKAVNARKAELESILKQHLKGEDELTVNGYRYKMLNIESRTYPLQGTLELLQRMAGLDPEKTLSRIVAVDPKAVDVLLAEQVAQKSKQKLIKAELDAIAERTYSPRFWAVRGK